MFDQPYIELLDVLYEIKEHFDHPFLPMRPRPEQEGCGYAR